MTQLRRQRRRKGARAPQRRKRRNLVKFIPRADSDFALTANNFATNIACDPGRFGLSADDAARITEAVEAFRAALFLTLQNRTRTSNSIAAKDKARRTAEEVVRQYANIIRAAPTVAPIDKALLRIKVRPRRLKQRRCPQRAPYLQFVGTGDGALSTSGGGIHVLRFFDQDVQGNLHRAKPDGAVRMELFVDLVPPGEPVPHHPAERGGRPWYLRSFTKSPIEVEYPVSMSGPMLVVYWARWANSTGEIGRFSKTCVARVEGWAAPTSAPGRALPDGASMQHVEMKYVIVDTPYVLPAGDDEVLPPMDVAYAQLTAAE